MEIKRWSADWDDLVMVETKEGGYILYSDYLAQREKLICAIEDHEDEISIENHKLQAKLDKAIEALKKVLPALRIANEDTTDEYYINVKKEAEKTLAEISETK